MPNGELVKHYDTRVLKAGKNIDKTRFNFSEVPDFEMLDNQKRIKVIYFNEVVSNKFSKQLDFYKSLYNKQNN